MRPMLALALLLLAVPARAGEADTWDLTTIFPDVAAWDAARADVAAGIDGFGDCRGRLARSAADLRSCLDRYFGLRKSLEAVWVHASCAADVDNRVGDATARRGDAGLLWSRLEEAASFVEPELLAAGEKKLGKLMGKDPSFAPYRGFVRRTHPRAAHTRDARGEGLLAGVGPIAGAPFDVYTMLTDADLTWPRLTLKDGSEVVVDKAAYTSLRAGPDRDDRRAVFAAYYAAVGGIQRTLGAALNGRLQASSFEARTRSYGSALEAALAPDGIPVAVYDTLIQQTNAHLPTLHRYLRLRARMLGVDDLGYEDIYTPLVTRDDPWPLARAKAATIEATRPLGAAYTDVLARGLESRWMDAYPQTGKASGAYATGVYGLHPFVLMNYQDDYESASTLAHEWGHAMHTSLASGAQPYPDADYDTFIAEVASTFNEALLLDHVLEAATTDDERLFVLGSALESLRGTFFRQAMFAEFQRDIQTRVEAGEALTGERISDAYLALLRRYHGADEGVMAIDPAYASEWAWIPHFYFGFYVFQYATSISASSLLSARVLGGEAGAAEAYLDLLRAGGSAHSYDLLKAAGVDLATPAPYEALAARMEAIMDRMEQILAAQPAPAAP
jgi:oligoendopeptidase F